MIFLDYFENGKSLEKNKTRNRPYGAVELPCASFPREKCDFSVNIPGRSEIWTFLWKMLKKCIFSCGEKIDLISCFGPDVILRNEASS